MKACQVFVAIAFVMLLIGAVGWFLPNTAVSDVWPWFVVAGMFAAFGLYLAIKEGDGVEE